MSAIGTRELTGRVDEIDGQVEKIHRLIDSAARLDPELGAGLATTESMPSVQKKIDSLAASTEFLVRQIRAAGDAAR